MEMKKVFILFLFLSSALLLADIKILSFHADKMLYRPGEKINFSADVRNTGKSSVDTVVKMTSLSGINDQKVIADRKVKLSAGSSNLLFSIDAAGEYGVEFLLEITADGKKISKSVFVEVYPGVIKFPRTAVICVDGGFYVTYPDKDIEKRSEKFKNSYTNIVKFFEWMPVWSDPVTDKEWWFAPRWEHSISKRRMKEIEKFKTSKAKIIKWKKELQQNGILLIGYDNLSVAPEYIWKKVGRIYDKKTRKPVAIWYKWENQFSPNVVNMAPMYGRKMRESVGIFGWDGFFHDSLVGWSRRTANAVDEKGNPATSLNYDGVQAKVIYEINKNLASVNPNFLNMVNGLPWEIMTLQREVEGKMLSITDRDVLKKALIANKDKFDPLTAKQKNVIWMSEVVTSRPANRLYHTFGLIHQSARQFTNQAVCNSSLAYRKWDKIEDFAPAIAMYYANGLGVYGNLRLSRICNELYRKYTEFAIRYSEFLFDTDLKWIAENLISSSDSNVYFIDTAFVKKSAGKTVAVMNLLNLPENKDFYKGEHNKPAIRKNFEIAFKPDFKFKEIRCFAASPDWKNTAPVELAVKNTNGRLSVAVPSLEYWNLLIWEFK